MIPPHWWRGFVAICLTSGGARSSAAQFGSLVNAVAIAPDSLVITDTTPTAPVTLSNTASEPVDVWLGPSCDAAQDSAEHGDPIAAAWHNQSSCAVPWLSDFPQHVVLAPLERRTFSVRMIPPVTLPDGKYAVRLIWAISLANVLAGGDTAGRGVQHAEVRITYIKGPGRPRVSRTVWQGPLIAEDTVINSTPDIIRFTDSTRSASFTLTNTGAIPTEVWLSVDCPWFRVNFIQYPESHQYESAWHGRIASAAFWLSGYPQHLTLAPHERRTITIRAFPDLIAGPQPAGSYYARIVYVQSPRLTVTANGDTSYTTPQGAITVVYHRGTPQRLTLGPIQQTRRPDGVLQVCATIQQPGLGVVAILHVAIDNAHGHTIADRVSAWTLDTTVAVWEVVHHDPMDGAEDGGPKNPDPVCFTLPRSVPARGQLMVSAMALGDSAQDLRARATVPLGVLTPPPREGARATLVPEQGPLATQLKRVSQEAHRRHLVPVLDLGAWWCEPCRALDTVLLTEALRPAMQHVYVIHLEYDLWHNALDSLGVALPNIPRMVALDARGRPIPDEWIPDLRAGWSPAVLESLRRYFVMAQSRFEQTSATRSHRH